jgi:hypothetical protein
VFACRPGFYQKKLSTVQMYYKFYSHNFLVWQSLFGSHRRAENPLSLYTRHQERVAMDLSKLEVAIHIHSTDTGSKNAPRLVSQKRTVDNLYSVRVENMEGKLHIEAFDSSRTCSLTNSTFFFTADSKKLIRIMTPGNNLIKTNTLFVLTSNEIPVKDTNSRRV